MKRRLPLAIFIRLMLLLFIWSVSLTTLIYQAAHP